MSDEIQQFRANIAEILTSRMKAQKLCYSEIITATNLSMVVVYNATQHGVVDLGDFVMICNALGLESPGWVLKQATSK